LQNEELPLDDWENHTLACAADVFLRDDISATLRKLLL